MLFADPAQSITHRSQGCRGQSSGQESTFATSPRTSCWPLLLMVASSAIYRSPANHPFVECSMGGSRVCNRLPSHAATGSCDIFSNWLCSCCIVARKTSAALPPAASKNTSEAHTEATSRSSRAMKSEGVGIQRQGSCGPSGHRRVLRCQLQGVVPIRPPKSVFFLIQALSAVCGEYAELTINRHADVLSVTSLGEPDREGLLRLCPIAPIRVIWLFFWPRLPAMPSGHAFQPRLLTCHSKRGTFFSGFPVLGSAPNDSEHAESCFMDSSQMIVRLLHGFLFGQRYQSVLSSGELQSLDFESANVDL